MSRHSPRSRRVPSWPSNARTSTGCRAASSGGLTSRPLLTPWDSTAASAYARMWRHSSRLQPTRLSPGVRVGRRPLGPPLARGLARGECGAGRHVGERRCGNRCSWTRPDPCNGVGRMLDQCCRGRCSCVWHGRLRPGAGVEVEAQTLLTLRVGERALSLTRLMALRPRHWALPANQRPSFSRPRPPSDSC